jgi:exonuclease III
VTEPLKARLASISVHKPARDGAPPSDHVPVTLEIADE